MVKTAQGRVIKPGKSRHGNLLLPASVSVLPVLFLCLLNCGVESSAALLHCPSNSRCTPQKDCPQDMKLMYNNVGKKEYTVCEYMVAEKKFTGVCCYSFMKLDSVIRNHQAEGIQKGHIAKREKRSHFDYYAHYLPSPHRPRPTRTLPGAENSETSPDVEVVEQPKEDITPEMFPNTEHQAVEPQPHDHPELPPELEAVPAPAEKEIQATTEEKTQPEESAVVGATGRAGHEHGAPSEYDAGAGEERDESGTHAVEHQGGGMTFSHTDQNPVAPSFDYIRPHQDEKRVPNMKRPRTYLPRRKIVLPPLLPRPPPPVQQNRAQYYSQNRERHTQMPGKQKPSPQMSYPQSKDKNNNGHATNRQGEQMKSYPNPHSNPRGAQSTIHIPIYEQQHSQPERKYNPTQTRPNMGMGQQQPKQQQQQHSPLPKPLKQHSESSAPAKPELFTPKGLPQTQHKQQQTRQKSSTHQTGKVLYSDQHGKRQHEPHQNQGAQRRSQPHQNQKVQQPQTQQQSPYKKHAPPRSLPTTSEPQQRQQQPHQNPKAQLPSTQQSRRQQQPVQPQQQRVRQQQQQRYQHQERQRPQPLQAGRLPTTSTSKSHSQGQYQHQPQHKPKATPEVKETQGAGSSSKRDHPSPVVQSSRLQKRMKSSQTLSSSRATTRHESNNGKPRSSLYQAPHPNLASGNALTYSQTHSPGGSRGQSHLTY